MTKYQQALKSFMESAEYASSSDPLTLHAPARMRTYLENRLKRAFDEGWTARDGAGEFSDPTSDG